jgi:hypothetical protein
VMFLYRFVRSADLRIQKYIPWKAAFRWTFEDYLRRLDLAVCVLKTDAAFSKSRFMSCFSMTFRDAAFPIQSSECLTTISSPWRLNCFELSLPFLYFLHFTRYCGSGFCREGREGAL